jgi:hypothetical protein
VPWVALYTPDFQLSDYCRWELYTALSHAYDLDGGVQPRILAAPHGVDYADVRPRRLAAYRLPPLGASVEHVATSIAAALSAVDHQVFGDATPRPNPPWWPYEVPSMPDFVGRVELWDLHDALVGTDAAELAGRSVVRVVGLGGQGKTVLVEEYARRFARDHPGGVFVLRGFGSHERSGGSASAGSLRDRQVATIARGLRLPVDGVKPYMVDAMLREHLDAIDLPYLWIVDDLPAGVDAQTFTTMLAPSPAGRTPGERWVVRELACHDLGVMRKASPSPQA